MTAYCKNPFIKSDILPVDIVFHPSWWYKHAGITFDEDFFYHPLKRVEEEQHMEKELYERFGRYGLGTNRNKLLPVIGAVHNAAGYIISEMIGCKVNYTIDSAPQVISADMGDLIINPENAFNSNVFKRLINLMDSLKKKYGYLTGDINWGGVLNVALDYAGQKVFTDLLINPEETKMQFQNISEVIEKFVRGISIEKGKSSVSENRNIRNIKTPVFLHSECSHTMISTEQSEEFLLPVDIEWSKKYRPFGIHYCGKDPHRHVNAFSKIKNLDFLDVGWGGDLKILRKHLPNTFMNIRLDPVNINNYTEDELEMTITRLVEDSGNPYLTGVCCINIDDKVDDEKIRTIFRTVEELRIKTEKEINS
ncbi:MAG: hypothetical protein QG611_1082 [Bacteroidota bacterium]|nr:hypothetical protein [Bacteroidota bacterium]